LVGYRMSATLDGSGNYTLTCLLSIYGMRQVDMNAVTVLYGQNNEPQNTDARAILTLNASTDVGTWKQIFQGQFQEGKPDYRGAPDVCLTVQSATAYGPQIAMRDEDGNPILPASYSGATSIAQIANTLSNAMGMGNVENNGVDGVLDAPYYDGSLMNQFRQLADEAGFDYYFTPRGTIAICPRNRPRKKTPIPMNSASGLIGYPSLERFGISLECLYNTAIELGTPLQITGSQVPGCDGLWFVYAFHHVLESNKPSGVWRSSLSCMRGGPS
jgi:hypothetical protein